MSRSPSVETVHPGEHSREGGLGDSMMNERSRRDARIAQAIEAAWPDLLTNLQTAYADLVNTRFELEGQTAELRQINDLFQQVVGSMSEGLFILDNTNRIVQVNPAAQRLIGVPEAECIGQTLFEFFSDQDVPGTIWNVLGRSQRGIITSYETFVQSRSGQITPVLLSASVMRDHADKITGLLVVATDITERKRAEDALRQAHDELEARVEQRTAELSQAVSALEEEIVERQGLEQRFRNLLESAPDAVVIVNEQGRMILVNSQTEQLCGYSRDELLGRPVEVLVPMRFRSRHLWDRKQYTNLPRTRSMGLGLDLFGLHKDGREIPVEISLSPLQTEEGLLITSTIRDVTTRKQAEKELKTSRERLRDLTARLQEIREEERTRIAREIHDQLGGAMTALKMDVTRLRNKAGDGVAEEYDTIMGSIDQTIQMIRRISSDLRPAVLDTWGLPAAIEWQLQEFQRRSDIQCKLNTSLDHIELAQDTATAVFRVFQETLTNVARHANASSVIVDLAMQDNYLILQVQDDGRGISPGELKNKKSLGLLGMQERMRLVSGELDFDGAPGKGTTVLVKVPVRQSADGANNESYEAGEQANGAS